MDMFLLTVTRRVCSPGGTTIEAVAELEKNGFRSAVMEAMKSCYNKTKVKVSKVKFF